MPRLIVIKGADEGKQFELSEDALSIGRDATNRVRLHDTEVSRRHAELRRTADGYRLTDVGSANGSFVNGQSVKDVLLQTGDQVQIGQSLLVYSSGQSESRADTDLAERISMIARHDVELSSAIVKSVGEAEGSRLLARPEQAEGPWLKSALANLGVVYETIQAVSHIEDVNELLEKIMDLIFRSIEADRGCVMLRNPDGGQLEPQALRWRDGARGQEKMPISRTVMEHVLREKEGVLVSDAAHDERFSGGQSIVRFGIREVICVPMKGRHETLGVLYLDTRSTAQDVVARGNPTGKFTEDHLKLASAIGHQAALAVEETRYHQALVQAERLAAVGQTIAALSHHIKNILHNLRSGSDILRRGLAEKDDVFVQKGWAIVEKSQGKIYDLVLDMLSYSKEREPAIEDTDVNGVVGEVLELVAARAEGRGIKLEVRLQPDLPPAQADPEGLHRAVLNIVGNAFDAVEDRPKPKVGVATQLDGDGAWVHVIVVDNGVGIPPERLGDIFRPFVSSKGARGTGLGLAVSRKILREHGGDVTAQSQPGKGSKFILKLPLKSPLAADGSHTEFPVAPPEGD
ncbi:MAG TPA: ATP-binding protein [Gemmataceae bacterium]|nr:ATP-binding protein [Gemmataceae bacterium]